MKKIAFFRTKGTLEKQTEKKNTLKSGAPHIWIIFYCTYECQSDFEEYMALCQNVGGFCECANVAKM